MRKALLHSAKLSWVDLGFLRSSGPGLGNLLFPIARACLGAERQGGVVVRPTMRQLKFGPALRGERDWRTYGDLFRRRTPREWGTWIRSKKLTSISEADYEGQDQVTIVYEGLANQFHDIAGGRETILSYFDCNTKGINKNWRRYDIAMHVRRGDFAVGLEHGKQNVQTPTAWYQHAWETACSILGKPQPTVLLFTDGDPEEIKGDLNIPNVELDASTNALLSILQMAQTDLLIGSRSSFSLWGNYLSGGQAIWPSQFELSRYKPVEQERDHFVEDIR